MSDAEFEKRKKLWEENILDPVLNKFPERKETFVTGSGEPLERVYFPEKPDEDPAEKYQAKCT